MKKSYSRGNYNNIKAISELIVRACFDGDMVTKMNNSAYSTDPRQIVTVKDAERWENNERWKELEKQIHC